LTVTRKQILPALHQSGKVRNSDLNEIGEKNYTATILKYANLAVNMPQLETDAKTVVGAINELHAHPGGSIVIPNPPIGENGIELEQGGYIELEQGGVLDTEQGGGHVVGSLYSISIDGDIYTVSGGGSSVQVEVYDKEVLPKYRDVASITVNGQQYLIPTSLPWTQTVYLKPNEWNTTSLTQQVSVLKVKPYSDVIVSPAPISFDEYIACQIRATELTSGKVTFTCKTLPSSNKNIVVYVTLLSGTG
jgi:hypothetical protein